MKKLVFVLLLFTACSHSDEQYAFVRNDTLLIQIKNPTEYKFNMVMLENSSPDSTWIEYFKIEKNEVD